MKENILFDTVSGILQKGNVSNFRREAIWIIEESSSCDQAVSFAERRAAGEPLQYILGTAPFRNLMLKVDRRVLIPRAETESLAQWIIDNAPTNGSVLDLGCGSGAIALSVASERGDLHVTAADISRQALELAEENARLCNISNIRFVQSDIFSSLDGCRFDVIGANLPYVTLDEYPLLPPEVRDFEPQLALTAEENGMALIRKCICSLRQHLTPRGMAIFELSPEQAPAAVCEIEKQKMASSIIKDLCCRDRFVTGKLL